MCIRTRHCLSRTLRAQTRWPIGRPRVPNRMEDVPDQDSAKHHETPNQTWFCLPEQFWDLYRSPPNLENGRTRSRNTFGKHCPGRKAYETMSESFTTQSAKSHTSSTDGSDSNIFGSILDNQSKLSATARAYLLFFLWFCCHASKIRIRTGNWPSSRLWIQTHRQTRRLRDLNPMEDIPDQNSAPFTETTF